MISNGCAHEVSTTLYVNTLSADLRLVCAAACRCWVLRLPILMGWKATDRRLASAFCQSAPSCRGKRSRYRLKLLLRNQSSSVKRSMWIGFADMRFISVKQHTCRALAHFATLKRKSETGDVL